MRYDVWFCRYEDSLYAVTAEPNEPPMERPRRVPSVRWAIHRLRFNGHVIEQVGILPPEMIGLDVEV